jgi:PASTA domain
MTFGHPATSLTLQLPDPAPSSTATIASQTMSPGASVPNGTTISVTF